MYGCPNCGTRHEGKYCPECGTKRQEEKSCPNCGAIQENSVKFCTECGYAFPSGADRVVTQPVFPPSKGLYYSAIKEKGKITAYSVMKGVCTDQKITVAAEHNGKPVVAVSDSAFEGCSHLLSVILPDSVKEIGNYAFYGCTSLTSAALRSTPARP